MARRHRLDAELVDQGFFETRDEAMRAVMAGDVSGAGFRFTSPGDQVVPGCELHVRGRSPFVSRGAYKLARGLEAFPVDVARARCLDVGCSTGGFTQVLLEAGAASVTAVDVGYAQFAWDLRQDPRVRLWERTNITDAPALHPELVGTVDLAVCDVSFTSVRTVLPAVSAFLREGGAFVTLVKPQFEAPASQVGEGGVVRDPAVRAAAVESVARSLEEASMGVLGCVASPITGAKGNHEYLLYARAGEPSGRWAFPGPDVR